MRGLELVQDRLRSLPCGLGLRCRQRRVDPGGISVKQGHIQRRPFRRVLEDLEERRLRSQRALCLPHHQAFVVASTET